MGVAMDDGVSAESAVSVMGDVATREDVRTAESAVPEGGHVSRDVGETAAAAVAEVKVGGALQAEVGEKTPVKTCQLCSASEQEDKLTQCHKCDSSFHHSCLKLPHKPTGVWLCDQCGVCVSCGCKSPGPAPLGGGGRAVTAGSGEDQTAQEWKLEYHEGKFLQTLCQDCSSYFGRGYFCPVCLRVYHDDETDSPMVCCDECDRWIHTECDGISEEQYRELSREDKSVYICCLCRGLVPEKVDTYHKKYRDP